MINILYIIRWPNLLIITISMLFTKHFLINPALGITGFNDGMSLFQFVLLLLATLSITIGGYLINDYFDMEVDGVNKPGSNQVGRFFPVHRVQLSYWVLTITGVALGSLLSWVLGQLHYALIFVFAAGLLWFYSARYQCMPFVGNIVVGGLSALSFGLVWVYEFFAFRTDPQFFSSVQADFSLVNRFVLIYMAFAFIVSLMREIIKDIEDFEGDSRFGCNTFAVAYGEKAARSLAILVAVVGLAFALWMQIFFFDAGFILLFGCFILLDLGFVIIVLRLFTAKTKNDFNKLSLLTKLLMLAGVLSMILIYFDL